jgi:hypothetical protein
MHYSDKQVLKAAIRDMYNDIDTINASIILNKESRALNAALGINKLNYYGKR